MSIFKYVPAMFTLMGMEDDLEAAADYIKEQIDSIEDIDGLKNQAIAALEAIGAKSDEAEEIILKIFDLIKSVTDTDITEDEVKVLLSTIYAYGKVLYTLLKSDDSLSELVAAVATTLGVDISTETADATDADSTETPAE